MNSQQKQKREYRGRPSKLDRVLDPGTAFEDEVWVKPPSQKSKLIFFSKMTSVADFNDSGNDEKALETLQELGIDLILITACNNHGAPFFANNERDLISDIDANYYGALISAGCEMIGIPGDLRKALLLDLTGDDDIKKSEQPSSQDGECSNQSEQQNPQG